MKKIFIGALLLPLLAINACNNQANKADSVDSITAGADSAAHHPTSMKNFISIAEIPVSDMKRATAFYSSILNISIEQIEMDGVQMGTFPSADGTVNVVLAKGNDYKPTTDGAVLYLNAGEDLQPALDKIESSGGKVILPKTQISPEMGYFALFIDSEGNKLGLHSVR